MITRFLVVFFLHFQLRGHENIECKEKMKATSVYTEQSVMCSKEPPASVLFHINKHSQHSITLILGHLALQCLSHHPLHPPVSRGMVFDPEPRSTLTCERSLMSEAPSISTRAFYMIQTDTF